MGRVPVPSKYASIPEFVVIEIRKVHAIEIISKAVKTVS